MCKRGRYNKNAHKKKSTEDFLKMSNEELKTVRCYDAKYGDKDTDKIVWTVLKDDEALTEDAMKTDDTDVQSPMKIDVDWSPETKEVNYNEIFFERFFPSIQGKTKLIDKFLDNVKCPMNATKENDNIKFHREGEADPDVLVSSFIIIILLMFLLLYDAKIN